MNESGGVPLGETGTGGQGYFTMGLGGPCEEMAPPYGYESQYAPPTPLGAQPRARARPRQRLVTRCMRTLASASSHVACARWDVPAQHVRSLTYLIR